MRRTPFAPVLIAACLSAAVFLTACGSKSSNNANSSSNNANKAATTNASPAASSMSPTAVVKAMNEANDKGDYATHKKYLSADSLKLIETMKVNDKTYEEAFKESIKHKSGSWPISNETIMGDTASVEVKGPDKVITVHLVKEKGEWKVALDQTMAQAILEEAMKEPSGEDEKEKGGEDDEHHENENH